MRASHLEKARRSVIPTMDGDIPYWTVSFPARGTKGGKAPFRLLHFGGAPADNDEYQRRKSAPPEEIQRALRSAISLSHFKPGVRLIYIPNPPMTRTRSNNELFIESIAPITDAFLCATEVPRGYTLVSSWSAGSAFIAPLLKRAITAACGLPEGLHMTAPYIVPTIKEDGQFGMILDQINVSLSVGISDPGKLQTLALSQGLVSAKIAHSLYWLPSGHDWDASAPVEAWALHLARYARGERKGGRL